MSTQTGFVLERVYHSRQLCVAEAPATEAAPTASEPEFNIGWDWRRLDTQTFEVAVTITMVPHPTRHERIEVTSVGRFTQSGEPAPLTVEQFAQVHATAILFPYARSVVTTLTGAGTVAPLLLPLLNIIEVAKQFDPAKATAALQTKRA